MKDPAGIQMSWICSFGMIHDLPNSGPLGKVGDGIGGIGLGVGVGGGGVGVI